MLGISKLSVLVCFAILEAISFGASGLRADIVYNNLAPGGGATSSDKTFANISRWGQQFTATSSGSFTNIKLNLYRTNSITGAFTIQLWSGSGSLPTASLATLKTLDWNNTITNGTNLNTSAFVEISTFENNYSVIKDSVYWLVLVQAGNGTAGKHWAIAGSGLGQTASYNSTTSAWTNTGNSANLGAQITVAVPEPGTFLLTVLGLAAGAGAAWKKRRGKSRD